LSKSSGGNKQKKKKETVHKGDLNKNT
jgi:hypothetical protein